MMQPDWDTIVLGVGGVGSAALYHCARRGGSVLGIDRFPPGHSRGSAHGETRAIRMAYFEHPAYVPMLRRAYALWAALERDSGEALFHRPGILQIGPPDGEVIQGVLRSARLHDLDVTMLTGSEVIERFPGFRVPSGSVGLLETDAGYLSVEACVRAHARCAVDRGATLWTGEAVHGWSATDGGVVVETTRGSVTARRLLVTAGAWAAALLPQLSLWVRRKTLHWYRPRTPAAYRDAPVFLYELPEGVFYGFPQLDGALKIAEHTGGEVVSDPLAVDRSVTASDHGRLASFLTAWMPDVQPSPVLRDAVCMYTMSPDEHFRIGTVPGAPQVRYVAGLSGHGFKFTSMLGELLASDRFSDPLQL